MSLHSKGKNFLSDSGVGYAKYLGIYYWDLLGYSILDHQGLDFLLRNIDLPSKASAIGVCFMALLPVT